MLHNAEMISMSEERIRDRASRQSTNRKNHHGAFVQYLSRCVEEGGGWDLGGGEAEAGVGRLHFS